MDPYDRERASHKSTRLDSRELRGHSEVGHTRLRAHLASLQFIGVNHVALNLRFNQADTESTLRRLADELLPDFAS